MNKERQMLPIYLDINTPPFILLFTQLNSTKEIIDALFAAIEQRDKEREVRRTGSACDLDRRLHRISSFQFFPCRRKSQSR